MSLKLDFEVIFNDPLRTIEYGPVFINKTCAECKLEKRIDQFYTVKTGSGMFWGYCHIGKCKICFNGSKKVKSRGFINEPVEKREKAIKLLNTTRWSINMVAKECEISANRIAYWLRSKPVEILALQEL